MLGRSNTGIDVALLPPHPSLKASLSCLAKQRASWVELIILWCQYGIVRFPNPLALDAYQLRNLTSIPRTYWSGPCMLTSTLYFSMARLSFRLPPTGSWWLSWSSWSQPNSTSSLAPSPPLETSRPPSHMNLQHMGEKDKEVVLVQKVTSVKLTNQSILWWMTQADLLEKQTTFTIENKTVSTHT